MRKYYLFNGQNNEGPFTLEELKIKGIRADSAVWYLGAKNWTFASELDELHEWVTFPPPPFEDPAVLMARRTFRNRIIAFVVAFLVLLGTTIAGIKYKEMYDVKNNFRRHPERYISLSIKDYNYNVLFGGVSDLKLSIANNSDFFIDDVKFLVKFIRRTGDVYKREMVEYSFLPAHESFDIRGPESAAGVDVEVELISVKCLEVGKY